MVAYNVQVAVDAKHHLIVTHEVTNQGHDRAALASMAQAARKAMGKRKLQVIADRGYYSGEQIKACEDTSIAAILPKPNTSRERLTDASLLEQCVYAMHDKSPMHTERLPPHQPMGARRRAGASTTALGPNARRHDGEKKDSRARVWHPQALDGVHALPDQATAQRQHGDELECAGLQPQASAWNPRVRQNDDGDASGGRVSPFKTGKLATSRALECNEKAEGALCVEGASVVLA